MLHKLILFSLLFLFFAHAEAQEKKTANDTVLIAQDSSRTKADSLKYLELEKLSKKSKLTKYLHNFIFRSLVPDAKKKITNNQSYQLIKGRIIRDIKITTLDPFGYALEDTLERPQGFFQKTANHLHIRTEPLIIRNLLLFKKNDPYDSIIVNESLRLIRAQRYVQNVTSFTVPVGEDSVDVYLRVLDVWSTVPELSLSPSAFNLKMTDYNFAGLGNTFQGEVYGNRITDENYTQLGYFVPNIRRTFIRINLQYLFSSYNDLVQNNEFTRPYYSTTNSNLPYLFSENKGVVKGLEVSRPFYSAVAEWAGGIFLGQMITSQSYIRGDSIRYLSGLTNIQDFWGARSWRLFRDIPDENITSLVLSGRFLRIRFKDPPPESRQENIFNSEDFVFAGLGLTSRRYIQDRYIFNYGKIEDIPVGRSFGITAGLDLKRLNRLYAGIKISSGKYYSFGYLGSELEFGTFIGASSGFHQAVLTGRYNYFTGLLTVGKWRLRQFINPTIVTGIKRFPAENLSLSDEIRGFAGEVYPAKNMVALSLQTQSYAPWNFYGFHFGPYFFCSLGMVGDEVSGFIRPPLYGLFGIGLLIKNDYLMFNNFQISFSFYPSIPGYGNNVFRFNAYSTKDIGFSDFEIKKPGIVNYR